MIFFSSIFCLFAADNLASSLEQGLKYRAAQLIDEKTMEAVNKAKENNTLNDKSGFLLGVSMTLKNFNAQEIISGFQELSNKTPSLNGGIILGYQHYFNTYVGFRLSAMINVGTQAFIKAQKLTPAYPAGSVPQGTPVIQDLYQSYIPIQGGAELKLLATVYEKEEHSFGFAAGLGYKIDWYVVQKASADAGTLGALQNLLQNPDNILNQGIYPEVGIYYYYGSHQFEITYRFSEFSLLGDKFNNWNFNTGGSSSLDTQTKFLKTDEITLSYLYRF